MITMIRTVWKLLQVVAACLITMLILSFAIPKYSEWRESNSVPLAVVRVEGALDRFGSWSKEKLGSALSCGDEVDYFPAIDSTVSAPVEVFRDFVGQDPVQSRYERNLKAITSLQEKLYK